MHRIVLYCPAQTLGACRRPYEIWRPTSCRSDDLRDRSVNRANSVSSFSTRSIADSEIEDNRAEAAGSAARFVRSKSPPVQARRRLMISRAVVAIPHESSSRKRSAAMACKSRFTETPRTAALSLSGGNIQYSCASFSHAWMRSINFVRANRSSLRRSRRSWSWATKNQPAITRIQGTAAANASTIPFESAQWHISLVCLLLPCVGVVYVAPYLFDQRWIRGPQKE